MGLVAPFEDVDVPEKSQSSDTLITTNDIATAVKDTFINRTPINKATYPNIYGTLLSYTEGIPTIVEYFKKREGYVNRQTIDTSFSGERSSVQFSLDRIKNFEIRLKEQIDVNVDPEATEVTINGTAIIYPGFKPNVGDIFYMKLIDNRIGAFIVNTTQPLSISHGTHYQIEFHFDCFINQDYIDKINASVSNTYYFDKQKYFSDEAALLSSESYNQFETLARHRKGFISLIMNSFYDNKERTIITDGNIFDTYFIEYLKNKIGMNDHVREICQIPNPYIGMSNTIWYAFLYQDLSVLSYTAYTLIRYQQYTFDVNTSNIDNFRLVLPMNNNSVLDIKRMFQMKFNETDTEFKTVSYIFSNRLYFLLLKSFETGSAFTEIDDVLLQSLINEMGENTKFKSNLSDSYYSVATDSYQDISYFDNHSAVTGSNNDICLPEIEYFIYDFIINDNIDIDYLVNKVLVRFPFKNIDNKDKVYYVAILLHLIDIAIQRLR